MTQLPSVTAQILAKLSINTSTYISFLTRGRKGCCENGGGSLHEKGRVGLTLVVVLEDVPVHRRQLEQQLPQGVGQGATGAGGTTKTDLWRARRRSTCVDMRCVCFAKGGEEYAGSRGEAEGGERE